MASFESGITDFQPFGKNEYRRSTYGLKYTSYTLSAASVPTETIDGSTEKVLQAGEVLAKITSGAESGKVGPFQAEATDGRQTLTNIVGVNDTFLPWQLLHRDVEVAACYEGTLDQPKCFERNAAGARIALTDTTAAAMVAKKTMSITFQS